MEVVCLRRQVPEIYREIMKHDTKISNRLDSHTSTKEKLRTLGDFNGAQNFHQMSGPRQKLQREFAGQNYF